MAAGIKRTAKNYNRLISEEIEKKGGSVFTYRDIMLALHLPEKIVSNCLWRYYKKGYLHRFESNGRHFCFNNERNSRGCFESRGRHTGKNLCGFNSNGKHFGYRQRKPLPKIAPIGSVADEVWRILQQSLEEGLFLKKKEIWQKISNCKKSSVQIVITRLNRSDCLDRWKTKYRLKERCRGIKRPVVKDIPIYTAVPSVRYATAIV